MAFFGARLDLRACFGDLAQTLLAPRQFVGNRHAIGNVRRVRRLGFGHQLGDLRLQLCLDLARVFIRQCAVPAGVGVDFRAVEPDRPHVQHAHLARQQRHLNEQPLDLLEKSSPERRNRVMVGMIVGRNEAERWWPPDRVVISLLTGNRRQAAHGLVRQGRGRTSSSNSTRPWSPFSAQGLQRMSPVIGSPAVSP